MKTIERVQNSFKEFMTQNPDPARYGYCDFLANDSTKTKRVYFYDIMGLDHSTHPNCHVNLSLYYDTHYAMSISFADAKDALDYVKSKGKIDRRIIGKESCVKGWKLHLKQSA